ncbi:NUDIX domain-containing protein [Paenibacillus solisilvae]|uniref:NUDIX domain-containing protein n=1 Tax=Paenibacillus solisilvae TaxID=2486751 RepID=A0ABW0W6V5_9BACL
MKEKLANFANLNLITTDDYPTLSGIIDWDIVTAKFTTEQAADESLISNISIAPVVGDSYVMMQVESGKWELAGGTLEPAEPYMDALKREVKEELGAELVSYTRIGHFKCQSAAEGPFRSHIPHPHFIRLVGYGEVHIVGAPLNPPDGEQVVAVEIVSIEEAVRRFEAIDRYDIAELYRLAHNMRRLKGCVHKERTP